MGNVHIFFMSVIMWYPGVDIDFACFFNLKTRIFCITVTTNGPKNAPVMRLLAADVKSRLINEERMSLNRISCSNSDALFLSAH